MNQARFDIIMSGNGIRDIEIPTGLNYVTVLNNTDNTVEVYQNQVSASNLQDALLEVVPYHNITIPIRNGQGTQFTVIYTDGGAVNEKRVTLIFTEENLGINSQTGSVSGSSNVSITSESIGLARQAQLPAALTAGGALKVETQNNVTIAGTVPVSSTQLPSTLTSAGNLKTISGEYKGVHGNMWNAAVVGVGGLSPSMDDLFNVSRVSVFGNTSAATDIIVQFSANNTNFYDTEYKATAVNGNFGFTFECAARYVRLKSSAAATITATCNAK